MNSESPSTPTGLCSKSGVRSYMVLVFFADTLQHGSKDCARIVVVIYLSDARWWLHGEIFFELFALILLFLLRCSYSRLVAQMDDYSSSAMRLLGFCIFLCYCTIRSIFEGETILSRASCDTMRGSVKAWNVISFLFCFGERCLLSYEVMNRFHLLLFRLN